jgi:hypothetical protein
MPTNTPYYTDDQWAQMMKLQDLTGQEQQIARQQAMAKDLREGGGNRIDKASQIAQGLRGISGAMLDYKTMKDAQGLSAGRKDWLNAMGQRRQQNSLPIAPPSVNNYDPSQFNDQTGQYGGV